MVYQTGPFIFTKRTLLVAMWTALKTSPAPRLFSETSSKRTKEDHGRSSSMCLNLCHRWRLDHVGSKSKYQKDQTHDGSSLMVDWCQHDWGIYIYIHIWYIDGKCCHIYHTYGSYGKDSEDSRQLSRCALENHLFCDGLKIHPVDPWITDLGHGFQEAT